MADEANTAKAEAVAKADTVASDSVVAEKAEVETKEVVFTPEQQAVIDKLRQSDADKVRTKYVKELAKEKAEKEALAKEKMTDAERAKFEIDKREKEIADRESKIKQAEIREYARDVFSANGLPSRLIPYFHADSNEAVDSIGKVLREVMMEHRKMVSEEILKSNGRTVAQSNAGGGNLPTADQIKTWSQKQVMDFVDSRPDGLTILNEAVAKGSRR